MDELISKQTTERYYREYKGGVKGWEEVWWRHEACGHLNVGEAMAEPLYDRDAPWAHRWTDTRIVCEVTTVELTVVDTDNL